MTVIVDDETGIKHTFQTREEKQHTSQAAALEYVVDWLNKRKIRHQRCAAYGSKRRAFVVIDGARFSESRWKELTLDAKLNGFEVVLHSATFEVMA